MAVQFQSVALPALLNININHFIDPNYDRFAAFKRAVKVLLKSTEMYRQVEGFADECVSRSGHFMAEIAILYELQNDPRVQNFDPTPIVTEVMGEIIRLKAAVTEFRGRANLSQAWVEVDFGALGTDLPNIANLQLNINSVEQRCVKTIPLTYPRLRQAMTDDQGINVKYFESYWGNPPDLLCDLTLSYRQLHCEGYRRLLVCGQSSILFSIGFDSLDTLPEEDINSFHLHTILFALQRRVNEFRTNPQPRSHIHEKNKRAVTCDMDLVEVEAWGHLWRPFPHPMLPMKYTDLQIGFRFGERMAVKPRCDCNEFCNWNAFFHFNPVIRFLLVTHSLHYIPNRTNIPQMYLLATALILRISQQNQRTPLVRLLKWAEKQRKDYEFAILRKPFLNTKFNTSSPNAINMEAITYMGLRLYFPVDNIVRETDQNQTFFPHSLYSIDKLRQTLESLHFTVGNRRIFVHRRHISHEWRAELESISYGHIQSYITWSYNTTIPNIHDLQLLFTEDAELSTIVPRNDTEVQLMAAKIAIAVPLLHAQGHLFTIQYAVGPLVNALHKTYQYIVLYEKDISLESFAVRREMNDFWVRIDGLFERDAAFQQLYQIDISLADPQITPIEQQVLELYKLKVYSQWFVIQNHCIKTFMRYTSMLTRNVEQVFTSYNMIWRNDWFEAMFFNNHQSLFDATITATELAIDYFRENVWQMPLHVTAYLANNALNANEIFTSLLDEYSQRRYFEDNNCEEEMRFDNFRLRFRESLARVEANSVNIFQNQIVVAVTVLRQSFFAQDINIPEVDRSYIPMMDELVYWLIRSTCFMIIRQTALLFKCLLSFEDPQLVNMNFMFGLTRPEFGSIMALSLYSLEILDELRALFEAYDDVFDRIVDTIEETEKQIKQMIKDLYHRTTTLWLLEIVQILHFGRALTIQEAQQEMRICLQLHYLSGMSFTCALMDLNRKKSRKVRKSLALLMTRPVQSQTDLGFQLIYHTFNAWFVTNPPKDQYFIPFAVQYWEQQFQAVFQMFDQEDYTQFLHEITH